MMLDTEHKESVTVKRISLILICVALVFSMLTAAAPAFALSKDGWLWPIPEHKHMSRGFYNGHAAVDLDASKGTAVRATKDGYVIRIYYGCKKDYSSGGYGSCTSSTCNPMVYENLQANNSSSYTEKAGSFYEFTSNGNTYKRCNGGFGIGLVIYHSDGSVSAYAHLSAIDETLLTKIKTGKAKVRQGDIIGKVGATGNAFGAHLHFQIGTSYGNWVNNNPASASFGIVSNNMTGLNSSNGYCYNTNGLNYVFAYEYELVATPHAGGTIQTNVNGKYRPGTKITVTAVPDEGYIFGRWTSDQVTTFSSNRASTVTFTMPSKKTWINAWFALCEPQTSDVRECTVVADESGESPVSRHVPGGSGDQISAYSPGDVVVTVGTFKNGNDEIWYKLTDGGYMSSEMLTPNDEYVKTLMLPKDLTVIDEEAFAGADCEAIVIPSGCTSIGKNAFANCKKLKYVRIPESVGTIASDAFEGCGSYTVDRIG